MTALVSVLLDEEVLLQLQVGDLVDEQSEDERLAVVDLRLAGHFAAGELHVALSSLGLEVGKEALYWLARLLPDSVKFCGPRLHRLLCHAAVDDVLEDPLFCEVLDLGPEAAVACKAMSELSGGGVRSYVWLNPVRKDVARGHCGDQ